MAETLAHGPYAEFALLLIISAVAGAIAVRLRQPVLIAYIVVGILVGPAVFGIVKAHDQVALLAEIGVKMSDPFGDDEVDFNVDAFMKSTYNNAVDFLIEDRALHAHGLPQAMQNPLSRSSPSNLRRWNTVPLPKSPLAMDSLDEDASEGAEAATAVAGAEAGKKELL